MRRLMLFVFLGACVVLGAQNPVRSRSEASAPPPQAAPVVEAPVIYQDKELFRIRTRLGSFTPEARARAITERIHRLTDDPFAALPALQVADQGTTSDVLCGDTVLMTLTEEDAKAEGMPRSELAQDRATKLQATLHNQAWRERVKDLAFAALWTLLVTVVGFLVLKGVNYLFGRLRARVLAIPENEFRRLRLQRLELIGAQRMRSLTLTGLTFLKALILVTLGYVYLSLVFSFFPTTKGLATRLLQLVMNPLQVVGKAILSYLPNIIFLVLIAVGCHYLQKLMRLIFRGIETRALRINGFHPDWADPTFRLVRIFIFAFGLVMAFPYLPGSGSEAFKGVSLLFGVLFSLGSSGAVSNVVAGILITYMRPFKVGDCISVGEVTGEVVEKEMLVTRLRTPKQVDVTIPNATILTSQVKNFSTMAKERGVILHTTVTIGYDAPWRTVHALLIAAAEATEGLLKDPKPFVLQPSLDDFYVSYQINAYTQTPLIQPRLYSDLHTNIQEKFNEAGVEIMSPHYRALREGGQTTIPADYLPSDYVSPAIRIEKVETKA
ncbi:MAG: mechanosensitive ion channel family protein [Firmicutes bacterium]|nr:mechanosensitive ion channel family protein [Bacillota bacterium]